MERTEADAQGRCRDYRHRYHLRVLPGAYAGTFAVATRCRVLTGQPEYPHNARLLTPIERDYAVWRLEREAGAGEANENIGTWKGFMIGCRDPKMWALIFCNMMSQGEQTSSLSSCQSFCREPGLDRRFHLLMCKDEYN